MSTKHGKRHGEALAKVELYRYLNEPEESESICRDILAVDPNQQLALRLLGLCLTDQFSGGSADRYREVEEIFQRLADRYEQLYYMGLYYERRAKAQLRGGQSPHAVFPLFERALAGDAASSDHGRVRAAVPDNAALALAVVRGPEAFDPLLRAALAAPPGRLPTFVTALRIALEIPEGPPAARLAWLDGYEHTFWRGRYELEASAFTRDVDWD